MEPRMTLDAAQLAQIAGGNPVASNIASIVTALDRFGATYGLDQPHRLAHFIAQIAEESGGFRYDREIWGNTAAQKRYDTRTDLGNTPEVDGDGKLYAGRGPLQITGKANYAAFRDWCRKMGYQCPDFVANPDAINTDPWEGLGPIWFWTMRKLNAPADENDIETITKRINGGLNGFDVRVKFYVRTALVLLGYAPDDVEGFQRKAQADGLLPADVPGKKSQIDGDAGNKTRSALHMTLVALDHTGQAAAVATPAPVVTEVATEVPVVPKGSDKPGIGRWFGSIPLLGAPIMAFGGFDRTTQIIIGAIVLLGVLALLWRGEQIAMRAKKVIASFES